MAAEPFLKVIPQMAISNRNGDLLIGQPLFGNTFGKTTEWLHFNESGLCTFFLQDHRKFWHPLCFLVPQF